MTTYTVYSRWVATALRRKGFKIIATDVNYKKPEFDTYIFENSQELQDAMTEIMENRNK